MKVTGREISVGRGFLIGQFFQNEWIFTLDCQHCQERTAVYQGYYGIPGFKNKAKL